MFRILFSKPVLIVLIFLSIFLTVYFLSPSIIGTLFGKSSVKGVSALTNDELLEAGLYDVTTFGAVPNDDNDDSAAIQKAIDVAYRQSKLGDPNRGAVFFPSGTYIVKKTLNGLTNRKLSRQNGVMLLGSTRDGEKPKLVVPAGTFNDGNSSNDMSVDKKSAIIHIFACKGPLENSANAGAGCLPSYAQQKATVNRTDGGVAMQMSSGIMNLEFVIEENNPDAIGVRFAGAQNNIISNVKITALGDSFAGLYSMIGTDSVVQDLEITGGKIGIHADGAEYPTFSNIVLKNQSMYAISGLRSAGPASINGFYIEKDTAPVISDGALNFAYNQMTNGAGAYALSDGAIKITNPSSAPAIDNPQGKQITMQNVYFYNAPVVTKWHDGELAGSSSGWTHVPLYAKTMKNFLTNSGASALGGVVASEDLLPEIIDTPESSESTLPEFDVPEINPDIDALLRKHAVSRELLPSPDVIMEKSKLGEPGYVNVTDRGIVPLTSNLNLTATTKDHTQALQEILSDETVKYVLLPRGYYLIKQPLVVSGDKVVMGVANFLSEIRTHPSYGVEGQEMYMLQTEDDPDAKPVLANMRLFTTVGPKKPFGILHVQSGDTTVYGVMYRAGVYKAGVLPTFMPRNKMLISGNGGGRFYGIGTGGSGNTTQWYPGFRGVKVIGTTKPITFYALNPEDGGYTCKNKASSLKNGCSPDSNSIQVEVRDAQNVSFRGWKCEDYHSLYVTNTTNVFANGVGGCADWLFEDVDQAMVLNVAGKFNASSTRGPTEGNKSMFTEKFGGVQTVDLRMKHALSIYTRGDEPNFAVWNR